MAYSRGAIANVCMLSKSDWRVGSATFPHTFTHGAHDTVSSQLMHCYIRVRALLLYILYALCFGKIYISTVCTGKISGPPSKAGPNYYIARLINHDGVLYPVLPGRIYLIYKEKSIVRLSFAPARICPGHLPDAGLYMAPSIGPVDMDNRAHCC